MLCKIRAATSHFLFFMWMEIKLWNGREVDADQGCAHCFALSFYHSLVSDTHATELVLDSQGFSETFDLLDST